MEALTAEASEGKQDLAGLNAQKVAGCLNVLEWTHFPNFYWKLMQDLFVRLKGSQLAYVCTRFLFQVIGLLNVT